MSEHLQAWSDCVCPGDTPDDTLLPDGKTSIKINVSPPDTELPDALVQAL